MPGPAPATPTARRLHRLAACAALLAGLTGGCASLTNPVADGVPVRKLPAELLAVPKAGEHTIPLSCLGQPRPDVYRLARGDVLAIFVEGFLGDRNQPLPVQSPGFLQIGQFGQQLRRTQPATGYP